LAENILPNSRYFSYIEITNRAHQSLWDAYQELSEQKSQFAIKHIKEVSDIYPVFRQLFEKKLA